MAQPVRTKAQTQPQVSIPRLLLRLLFGGIAVDLIALEVCSRAGLVSWNRPGNQVGAPWNQLLNAWLGPKMARMLAGEAVVFVLLFALTLLLRFPVVRGVAGNGTLVVLRRFVAFAWLAAFMAAYLLSRINPVILRTEFNLHGDAVVLTLPTLIATLLFGMASMILVPRPRGRYLPRPLEWLADAAPLLVAVGVAVALARGLAGPARVGGAFVDVLVTQITLPGVEIAYVLIAIEACLADLADVRLLRLRGRGVALLGSLRAAGRLVAFVGPVLVGVWLALGASLPAASVIVDRHGGLVQVYDRDGVFRLPVAPGKIAPVMDQAIDAIEDPGVYESPDTHSPINPVRVAGIFTAATRTADDGVGDLSGGSGIAVQSCKNFVGRPLVTLAWQLPGWFPGRWYLAAGATLAQKIGFEFPCGWAFERAALPLGSDRSPTRLYLNEIYFGHGAYGVEAASLTYFGRHASQLTTADAALLAGLPQSPSFLDPWQRPEAVRRRRHEVLSAMAREGYLSPTQAAAIDAAPLGVLPRPTSYLPRDSAFAQYVLSWLDAHGFQHVSTAGLTVTTTIDLSEQYALEADVARTVKRLQERGVNNGGALEVDPRTGEILAWVGGVAPDGNPYFGIDLVNQYPHQPGSTIKPLLYSCALERGVLKPGESLDDDQRVIGGRFIANWNLTSQGMRPASDELAQSRNTAAAELARRLTPLGFADCLRNDFGVSTDLEPDRHGVELGIGLAEMPMTDLAAGYTALANNGDYHELAPVLSVRSTDGRELYGFEPGPGRTVLSCATVDWVKAPLQEISRVLRIPGGLATKTGTTPSSSYAVGYGPDLILAAWVGRTAPGEGRLSIDDVYGREGGAVIWQSVAERLRDNGRSTSFPPCR